MNLVIDQGNTFCKLAVFDQDDMIDFVKVENAKVETLKQTIKHYSVEKAIISSVSDFSQVETLLKEMDIPTMLLSHQSVLPIKIKYTTPDTLGLDRIAAAVGAWKLSPDTSNLIIDLGTCITYDVMTPQDGFIGGNIAPGLDMRLTAMHRQTQNLPLLQRQDHPNTFGSSTNEAMQNGAEKGIIAEINSYMSTGYSEYGELSTFLTGGDALYFEKKIKNTIFVIPNLLLLGLLEILKNN